MNYFLVSLIKINVFSVRPLPLAAQDAAQHTMNCHCSHRMYESHATQTTIQLALRVYRTTIYNDVRSDVWARVEWFLFKTCSTLLHAPTTAHYYIIAVIGFWRSRRTGNLLRVIICLRFHPITPGRRLRKRWAMPSLLMNFKIQQHSERCQANDIHKMYCFIIWSQSCCEFCTRCTVCKGVAHVTCSLFSNSWTRTWTWTRILRENFLNRMLAYVVARDKCILRKYMPRHSFFSFMEFGSCIGNKIRAVTELRTFWYWRNTQYNPKKT